MMTLNRRRWWNGLSANEKYWRREILLLKSKRKEEKHHASTTWSSIVKKTAVTRINRYTAHIRAMKHELERGKVAKVKKTVKGEFYCSNCCQFVQRYDNYCATCGRKLRWIVEDSRLHLGDGENE